MIVATLTYTNTQRFAGSSEDKIMSYSGLSLVIGVDKN